METQPGSPTKSTHSQSNTLFGLNYEDCMEDKKKAKPLGRQEKRKTPLPMHIFGACRKKLNFLPLFLW